MISSVSKKDQSKCNELQLHAKLTNYLKGTKQIMLNYNKQL